VDEPLTTIAPRRIEATVLDRLAVEPVVFLGGARTVGKSTLLRRLADQLGRPILDLDEPGVRDAVADDPAYAARDTSPVLVDELQHAPELLDAIKAELNCDLRPGRFLLTGSTRYATLPRAAQSLTGRVDIMSVWPLSQGEIDGRLEDFLPQLLDDPAGLRLPDVSPATFEGYAERVLAGGFPLPLGRPAGPARARWFRGYVDLVTTRDVLDIRRIRQRDALPLLLRRLAARTGQLLNLSALSRDAGIEPSIGHDYVELLEAVFLIHRLPAFGTTLGSRIARNPKLHLVDTGLGGWLLGLRAGALSARDPSSLTEYGHLLETFAVNEILKQLSWSDELVTTGHYRTHDGHEVDLVLERDDGRVCAVEVKASARVRPADVRGMAHLRDRLGRRFAGGVVLYTGQRSYAAADRVQVVPLERLWR
jgi:predicted AAA+ superfamily ATPase